MIPVVSEPRLPLLRQELEIAPGPVGRDGSPNWTLHDPPTGRFIRLGWQEFEILRRWHAGTPAAIAAAVAAETSLRPSESEVRSFADMLAATNLVRPTMPDQILALHRQYLARHNVSWAWLALKNYLFIRIPIVRPDAFLTSAIVNIAWIFSNFFVIITLLAGFIGLILIVRQWEAFTESFPYLTTGEGVVLGLLALMLIKVLHELGHGFTAKREGCRPRTAGIAIMLFVPLFYTDVTDAWRLTDKYARLRIGVAGIATELAVACWSLLLWNLLPDGPLRSVVFVWATSTWLLTLTINANPLMRFDGYYLLSDVLDEPNLQDTAFRLGRWHMRKHVFGLRELQPDGYDARRRRLLIAYAYATWVYRLLLFLGIAAVVYLATFKILGMFLALVEIVWFIIRPIAVELRSCWTSRAAIGVNFVMIRTLLLFAAALGVALVPWRGSVHGDALFGAEYRTILQAPAAGQVMEISIDPGLRVKEGQMLFRLASPQLEHEAERLRRTVENLGWQIDTLSGQQDSAARARLLVRERDTARMQLASAAAAIAQLELRAPFAGEVVETADTLRPLEWVERGEPLALLVDRSSTIVEALITEQDVRRVSVGAKTTIHPRNPDMPAFTAAIEVIEASALRALPDPVLSSTRGGPIPAREAQNGQIVPETPVYRVRLRPTGMIAAGRMEIATIRIEATTESLATRLWRNLWGVALRESGF